MRSQFESSRRNRTAGVDYMIERSPKPLSVLHAESVSDVDFRNGVGGNVYRLLVDPRELTGSKGDDEQRRPYHQRDRSCALGT